MPSILESGKAQVDQIAREKPQSVSLGAHVGAAGEVEAAATVDYHWRNGWGLTVYGKAWWKGLPVTTNDKPKKQLGGEAGFEATKKF